MCTYNLEVFEDPIVKEREAYKLFINVDNKLYSLAQGWVDKPYIEDQWIDEKDYRSINKYSDEFGFHCGSKKDITDFNARNYEIWLNEDYFKNLHKNYKIEIRKVKIRNIRARGITKYNTNVLLANEMFILPKDLKDGE